MPCSGSPLRNSLAWPRACCMSAKLKLELRHLGNVSFISAIVSTWNTKQAGRGVVERETTDYSRLLHGKVPWTNQTVERQNGQNSWAKYASWPWQFWVLLSVNAAYAQCTSIRRSNQRSRATIAPPTTFDSCHPFHCYCFFCSLCLFLVAVKVFFFCARFLFILKALHHIRK